jgi:O-glycosyl hydrolase
VRAGILIVVAVAGMLALCGGSATAREGGNAADASSVTVDLAASRQVIQGFGSSNRVWSDPHLGNSGKTFVPAAAQAQILTALYRRLGLTRVRNVLEQGVQRTPGGPFEFRGKLADDHVAFVKQARRYGLKTFFPGPVYMEPWMKPDDPDSYVDWAMAMLRRWRALGLEPPLYAPLNEPAINGDFSPQWFHDVVIRLGGRLRAAGFKTKFVIPDDENPRDAYRRTLAVLQDPAARQYVGALAYHVYRWDKRDKDELARMRDVATRYKLPVWMTEYSTKDYRDWNSSFEWAERMHVLLTDGGVNAIDYLWGYFGDWVRTDTMISIAFDDGAYRGFSATPIYWITGQYSRYVRPGFVRVGTTPTSDVVLTSAYKGPRRAIVVATNPDRGARTIRITVKGGRLKGVVRPVRSSSSEQWRNLAPITPRNGSFTATLPPQSVTTFVATR